MAGTDLEPSMLSLIRDAAERASSPDSAAITEQVLSEMDQDQLRHYAARGVHHYVNNYFAQQRRPQNGNGANGSARWDAVKADKASGELDLARYSVFTGRSRKWLLDCNPDDLLGAADYHSEIGDSHHMAAMQLQDLAKVLKAKKGAEVVGDLPEQKVLGLLASA
jgi:hypothetical protein